MREIQNDCCECPDMRCVNCEKGRDYEVISCDICDCSEEDMFEYGGKDYCEDCLFITWINEHSEDVEIVIKPGKDCLKDVLEYLASCTTNYATEFLNYLSESSLKKWIGFRNECEIRR